MELDSQAWIGRYERLKFDFQRERKNTGGIRDEEVKDMMERITSLEKELSIMKDSPMQYDLWTSEIARRMFIIDALRRQIGTSGSDGTKSVASSVGSTTSIHSNATVVVNPITTTDRGLVQRQKDVMKQQDLMIGDIEKGLDNLHQTALEIGQESKMQSRILDDLDTHVDQTTDALREETKHTEQIRDSTNNCYGYMCIVLEVAALLILVLIFFVHV